ncbi:MAG: insulinase family protein [Candidatus Obscuribacterales bacterium]|nr:insulinase family protein [Candidatus Obscuribacterales bacterium]
MKINIPAYAMSLLGYRSEYEGKHGNVYRLVSNGMPVILCPIESSSTVVVNVPYWVGSRNEPPFGATHFLEHLMFKGSRKFNPRNGNDIETVHKKIGASNNATTWLDRTHYYTRARSKYLKLLLEIEADRMQYLEFTQEDRDSEMTVVRNEFEIGENNPREALSKAVWAAAFTSHPYKTSTIGTLEEVENVTVAQLMHFYNTFYAPNNAAVQVIGKFNPLEALTWISKFFSPIPAKPIPPMISVEPEQQGEKRVLVKRAGDSSIVHIVYHIPEARHEDTYPLAVLAQILGSSATKSGVLYKTLIDTNMAIEADCVGNQNRDPSLFEIVATVAPGQNPEAVEQVILSQLDKLKSEPIEKGKLADTKKSINKHLIQMADDPSKLMWPLTEDMSAVGFEWFDTFSDQINKVTKEQIMSVAQKYFKQDNRTVGYFIPKDEEDEEPEQPSPPDDDDETPELTKGLQRATLSNGLNLVVLPKHGTGLVSVAAKFLNGGNYFVDEGNGYAPSMVANMLIYGSQGLDKNQLATALEKLGIAEFDFAAGTFFSGIYGGGAKVVKEDLPKFLSLFSKVVTKPTFDEAELKKLCEQTKGEIENTRTDEDSLAETALCQLLYDSKQPYYQHDVEENLSELSSLTRDDLVEFYKAHYSPKSTIISIVGDITTDEAVTLMEKYFGQWSGPEAKSIAVEAVPLPDKATRKEVFVKDKTSVSIVCGLPASLKLTDADYPAAWIANSCLGGNTIDSRLGKVIRVQEGLTYGVRSKFEDLSFGFAPWSIELTVNPENLEKALELVHQVTRDYVEHGMTQEELDDEKSRLVGYHYISLDNTADLASRVASYEALGLGAGAIDTFAERLMAVTLEEVNAAIRKYFTLDHAVTVVAGTLLNR